MKIGYGKLAVAATLALTAAGTAFAQQSGPAGGGGDGCLLVHVTTGPENATKAALAFLVARAALDEGRQVRVFLAGAGALLLRDAVLDSVVGVGTGRLRESYDGIIAKGGKFYVSGLSAKARGMTQADFTGKPVELAMPAVLVRQAFDCSRTIVY